MDSIVKPSFVMAWRFSVKNAECIVNVDEINYVSIYLRLFPKKSVDKNNLFILRIRNNPRHAITSNNQMLTTLSPPQ